RLLHEILALRAGQGGREAPHPGALRQELGRIERVGRAVGHVHPGDAAGGSSVARIAAPVAAGRRDPFRPREPATLGPRPRRRSLALTGRAASTTIAGSAPQGAAGPAARERLPPAFDETDVLRAPSFRLTSA